MRSKGGFTLFIIIVIVALVVSVGVGGFLMFREKMPAYLKNHCRSKNRR